MEPLLGTRATTIFYGFQKPPWDWTTGIGGEPPAGLRQAKQECGIGLTPACVETIGMNENSF
jgi:hypothetical protein